MVYDDDDDLWIEREVARPSSTTALMSEAPPILEASAPHDHHRDLTSAQPTSADGIETTAEFHTTEKRGEYVDGVSLISTRKRPAIISDVLEALRPSYINLRYIAMYIHTLVYTYDQRLGSFSTSLNLRFDEQGGYRGTREVKRMI